MSMARGRPPGAWIVQRVALATTLPAAALLAAMPSTAAAQTPVFGLHAAGPVQASAAVGVWLGSRHPRREDASGVIAVVEPGLRGGRASLGYAYALSGLGAFVTGRATALRTWRVSTGPRTYGGVEVQLLPVLAIGPRLSAFVPVDRRPHRVLWMLDVGIGL